MKLRELASLIPNAVIRGNADVDISGIANHSRRVKPDCGSSA